MALLSRLGLPAHTQRVPQHHLGCHGGLRCLALAAQIARGNPAVRPLRACTRRAPRQARTDCAAALPSACAHAASVAVRLLASLQARVLVVYGDVMSMLGAFMPTPIAAEDLRSVALFTDGAAGTTSAALRCVAHTPPCQLR